MAGDDLVERGLDDGIGPLGRALEARRPEEKMRALFTAFNRAHGDELGVQRAPEHLAALEPQLGVGEEAGRDALQ